ncbi:MAG: ATP-binding protein [Clostridia bacterium]|nr:ATP-binding protein [Clostridia bacterium]
MAYDLQTFNKILAEYEQIRAKNEALRQNRIKEVYTRIPRIEEIDDEINRMGFSNIQKIIQNPLLAVQYNQEFKQALQNLEKEKNTLLVENGFPLSYMDMEYQCEICGDTGYDGGKKCKCFEQKLINAAYSNSNLGKSLREQNFDMFSFSYYSKKEIPNENVSPFERMQNIYDICLNFAKNFDSYPKSLLFYGGSGLGKTFLSSCIAKALLDQGKTVIYTRATRLFSMYEDYKFGRNNSGVVREQIDKIFDVDLLIIDDLGTEQQNKTTTPFLFDILNTRLLQEKKIIISTNYTMNELTKIYSLRFTSRIYEYFTPLKFLGDDIRVQKMIDNQ